jgi:hypothetical protein
MIFVMFLAACFYRKIIKAGNCLDAVLSSLKLKAIFAYRIYQALYYRLKFGRF